VASYTTFARSTVVASAPAANAVLIAGRQAPALALLAELEQHVGQLALGPEADQLQRGRAGAGVHAHVDRPRPHEREPALGLVELRRRHPEVEHQAVDPVDAQRVQVRAQVAEPTVHQRDLHAGQRRIVGQPGPGRHQRPRIAIDADQPAAGASTMADRRGVAATAEGAVAIDPARDAAPAGRRPPGTAPWRGHTRPLPPSPHLDKAQRCGPVFGRPMISNG
jgi:hypothetical protein